MNPDPTRLDAFGCDVSLDGDRVLVGAFGASLAGPETGAANLFDRDSGDLLRIFVGPSARPLDGFGTAVAITGNSFYVGSPRDDTVEINGGAVYRFDPPIPQDIVKCYKSRKGPGTEKFDSVEVLLENFLDSKQTTLRKPKNFCNPAGIDGSSVLDPNGHLTCFSIKDVKGQPKFARRDVRLWNRFGAQTLTLLKARELCVPSSLNGATFPSDLDYYQCYKAKRARNEPKFQKATVALDDPFDDKQTVVIKPSTFCAAVDLDSGGIMNPDGHLTCYKIKDDSGQAPFARVDSTAGNPFGDQILTAVKGGTVCVPTQVFP